MFLLGLFTWRTMLESTTAAANTNKAHCFIIVVGLFFFFFHPLLLIAHTHLAFINNSNQSGVWCSRTRWKCADKGASSLRNRRRPSRPTSNNKPPPLSETFRWDRRWRITLTFFSLSLSFSLPPPAPRGPHPPVRFDCRHEIQRTVKGQSRGGVATTTTGYNKYLPTSRDGCRERRCHKGKETWTRAGRWFLGASGGAGEEKIYSCQHACWGVKGFITQFPYFGLFQISLAACLQSAEPQRRRWRKEWAVMATTGPKGALHQRGWRSQCSCWNSKVWVLWRRCRPECNLFFCDTLFAVRSVGGRIVGGNADSEHGDIGRTRN